MANDINLQNLKTATLIRQYCRLIRIDLSNISILKDIKLDLGQRIADEDLTVIEAYKIPTTDVRTWTGNRKNGKAIYESGRRPHWSTQM